MNYIRSPRRQRPSDRVLRSILSRYFSAENLDRNHCRAMLQDALSAIDAAIAQICQGHKTLEFLYLLRAAVAPQLFLGGNEFPLLQGRILRILTLAVLKYGKRDSSLGQTPKPMILNRDLSNEVRMDIAQLIELAEKYLHLMRLWYAFGSGAEMRVQKLEIVHTMPEDLERLADLENRRLERNAENLFASVASISSFPIDVETMSTVLQSAEQAVMIAVPAWDPNVPSANFSPSMRISGYHNNHSLTLNYLYTLYDFSDFRQLANLDRNYFEDQHGISVDELLLVLQGLTHNHIARIIEDTQHAESFYLTGMGYHALSALTTWMEHWIANQKPNFGDRAPDIVKRVFERLVISNSDYGRLDLRDPGPPSFLLGFGPIVIVDWTSVAFHIVSVLDCLVNRPDMANIKGAKYEVDLLKWLQSRIPSLKLIFPPNQKIRSGGKLVAEVDLAFHVGSIGFVVDCKAYSASMELLHGDETALNTRWGYTEKWLSQIIKTTGFLARNPIGDNYSIPDTIKQLVPLVCSPHVEPIFDLDEMHLVHHEQPRICTPFELVELLSAVDRAKITANQFTYEVSAS